MKKTILLLGICLPVFLSGQSYDNPNAALGYWNQAKTFFEDADFETSAVFYAKAAEVYKQLEMWEDYYSSLNNTGKAYQEAKLLKKAKKTFKEVLWEGRKHLGAYHPYSVIAAHHLGTIYALTDQHDKALECHNIALGINRKIFGGSHSEVALSFYKIGQYYASTSNYEEAVRWFQKALKTQLAIFEEDQEEVIQTQYALANAFTQIGNLHFEKNNYDAALPLYQKAVELFPLSIKDLSYLKTLNLIAICFFQKGFITAQEADFIAAYQVSQQCSDLIDTIRSNNNTLEEENDFIQFAEDIYYQGISSCYHLYQINKKRVHLENAFYFAEKINASKWLPEDEILQSKIIGIVDLQKKVTNNHTAVLAFVLKEQEGYQFTISNDQVELFQLQADNYISQQIAALNNLPRSVEHLIVLPDGLLKNLPLPTFTKQPNDPELEALAARFSYDYAPSGTQLGKTYQNNQQQQKTPFNWVGFGVIANITPFTFQSALPWLLLVCGSIGIFILGFFLKRINY